MSKIKEALEKHSFRQMNINLFIIIVSFVIMTISMVLTNIWYVPIFLLTVIWVLVAGINLVGWAFKVEEYLEKYDKEHGQENHENKENNV